MVRPQQAIFLCRYCSMEWKCCYPCRLFFPFTNKELLLPMMEGLQYFNDQGKCCGRSEFRLIGCPTVWELTRRSRSSYISVPSKHLIDYSHRPKEIVGSPSSGKINYNLKQSSSSQYAIITSCLRHQRWRLRHKFRYFNSRYKEFRTVPFIASKHLIYVFQTNVFESKRYTSVVVVETFSCHRCPCWRCLTLWRHSVCNRVLIVSL